MTVQQQEMVEYTSQDIVRYLMDDQKLSMDEAMRMFYSSRVCELLNDPETGLYLEESPYVYEMLKKELAHTTGELRF